MNPQHRSACAQILAELNEADPNNYFAGPVPLEAYPDYPQQTRPSRSWTGCPR